MKSSVRIEFDFETNQPVLRIRAEENSDDMRDKMLKAFIEKASSNSSRLYIIYPDLYPIKGCSIIDIRCEENESKQAKFDLVKRARDLALTLCKTDGEAQGISDFFDGFDAKVSLSKEVANMKV